MSPDDLNDLALEPEETQPLPVAINLDDIPPDLVRLPQWVGWRREQRDGKGTKVPINPHTGRMASVSDPATWGTFEAALTAVDAGRGAGIGFVLNEDDGLSGIDLDGARDPQRGALAPWAREIVDALNTYAETSPSGSGVHLWLKGKLPAGSRCRTDVPNVDGLGGKLARVEIYSRDRFFTVTGAHLPDTPSTVEDRQAELTALHHRLFGDRPEEPDGRPHPAVALDFTTDPSETDRLLAEKILREHPAILQTWAADESRGDFAFASEALGMLIRTLGPQTPDETLMRAADLVFRASPLFARSDREGKWTRQMSNYGARTLERALEAVRTEKVVPTELREKSVTLFASLRTLQDRVERPTEIPHPLIPDLVWPRTITMIYGPTGVGKTTFLVNLALHALGSNGVSDPHLKPQERLVSLDGGLPYPARPLRVLYLGAEDSLPMFEHTRLTPQVLKHYAIGPDVRDQFHYVLGRMTLAAFRREDVQLEALIQWITAQGKYDLVFLDPIMRFHLGFDENDNGHMAQVMAALDAIRERTDVAVIFTHHTGKAASRSISGNRLVRSDPTAARGGVVLADQSHTIYSLARGKGQTLVLTPAKLNYAERPRPLVFERSEGGVLRPVAGDRQLFEVREIVERIGRDGPAERGQVVKASADALKVTTR